MKSEAALSGSSLGLATLMRLDTAACFLQDREETIDMAPLAPVSHSGYVWRKVYHRRCS